MWDAVYEELRAKGLQPDPPKIAPYGMKQLYLRDPDGYGLCFQWPTERPTALQSDTDGMKTEVSLPDGVFKGAERLARRVKKSRSHVARHAPEEVTDAMDRVCTSAGDSRDSFVSAAAHRILDRSEW